MSDYFCTGDHRPDNDCGGPPPRPFPRPDTDDCGRPQNDSCQCPPRPDCDERSTCRQERCPCRAGLVQGLQMLLRSGLSSLVNFQSFAFVTEDFVVGDFLTAATPIPGAPYDNLGTEPAGSFNRFSPCACDYIDVTGAVYLPTSTTDTGLTASRLNLCEVSAIAFGVEENTEEGTDNYLAARRLLQRLLQGPCRPDCPPYPDPCDEPCGCHCDHDDFLGGSISLVTDGLLLANMTVLGKVGKLLVLANDTNRRFYFVCAEKATYIR